MTGWEGRGSRERKAGVSADVNHGSRWTRTEADDDDWCGGRRTSSDWRVQRKKSDWTELSARVPHWLRPLRETRRDWQSSSASSSPLIGHWGQASVLLAGGWEVANRRKQDVSRPNPYSHSYAHFSSYGILTCLSFYFKTLAWHGGREFVKFQPCCSECTLWAAARVVVYRCTFCQCSAGAELQLQVDFSVYQIKKFYIMYVCILSMHVLCRKETTSPPPQRL
jgi:hypothetical protein